MTEKLQTYKTILDRVITSLKVIRRNIFLITIVSLVFVISGVLLKPNEKYMAKSTMFLNGQQQSKLLNLVANIGIGGSNEVTIGKIRSVIFSKKTIRECFATKVVLKNQEDYMLNHLYNSFFNPKNDTNIYTLPKAESESKQNKVYKELINKLNLTQNKDELIIFTVTTKNKEISYNINKILLNKALSFFKRIERGNNEKTSNILQNKADSIQVEIKKTELKLENQLDKNYGSIRSKTFIERQKLTQQLQILTEIYSNIISQLEIVNFKIMDQKPIISVVDYASYPLEKINRSLTLTILVFGFVGFSLSTLSVFITIFLKKLRSL